MKLLRFAFPALLLLASLLIASHKPISAQGTDLSLNYAGDYMITGAFNDGSKPYQGKLSIKGTNPIYEITYSYNDVAPYTSPAIALGKVVVDGAGDPQCAEVVYSRAEEGTMVGAWFDATVGNALALETLIPTAKTTTFAGSYRIVGSNGDGSTYVGTVDIASTKDGYFTLDYHYPAVGTTPALNSKGYGLAAESSLGAVVSVDEKVSSDKCTLWVAAFAADGKSYTAEYYEQGKVGKEKATRTK